MKNYEPIKITKPIRLIELFGGYGSQALALDMIDADYKSIHLCEWEPEAVRSYHAIHYPDNNNDYSKNLTKEEICKYLAKTGISFDGTTPASVEMLMKKKEQQLRSYYNSYIVTNNLGSIVSTKGEDLDITDPDKYTYMMTYSWPCFTSDSLVMTKKGYKKINEVKIGDDVLTHTGLYKKVENTYINGIKPTCRIVSNLGEVRCTYDHRFYVRTMKDDVLGSPVWKPASMIDRNDFLAVSIPKKEKVPKWGGISSHIKEDKYEVKDNLSDKITTEEFWYIIGAYTANGNNDFGIKIYGDMSKLNAIEERVRGLFEYNLKNDYISIESNELYTFLNQYNLAHQNINNMIINLPCDLLRAFLEGLLQRNNKHNKYYKFKSTNKEFIYALSLCILKVFKRAYQVTEQKDGYVLLYKGTNSANMFCDENYCYCKFKELIPSDPDTVYDIEVEKYHSLTVQNVIVHNCQSLSVAGKMEGMKEGSGTVSSMLWEVKRLLKELRYAKKPLPQILFAENVKQVLSEKNGNKEELDKWISFLKDLGYSNYYKILNAKDYNIPQNRERFFMFSFLSNNTYNFPEPQELQLNIEDILETDVDENYYIKTENAERLINDLLYREIIQESYNDKIKDCESNIIKIGTLNPKFDQIGRVYSIKGISPTIPTASGGGHIPKILQQTQVGAIRNRYVKNTVSDKKLSSRIEVNKKHVCNTLTSVQKDNIIIERK